MQMSNQPSNRNRAGPGALAGLAGTVVMTGVPEVHRDAADSALGELRTGGLRRTGAAGAPDDPRGAAAAELRNPLRPRWHVGHRLRNRGRGRASGHRAVNAVFGVVYTGDVLLNTALGLYQPERWTAQEWGIGIMDKYVQAAATGVVFDRVLDPARSA